MTAGLRRRVRRLERERQATGRLRVAAWWLGRPEPVAEPGESLVVVRRLGGPPAPGEAGG